ncbi:adenosine receptor A1-like [Phyllopteryx taeniolatus]|uniref:adenosine receptor A1-like n=1 Tax=Phyllopteryx taeniolatus TaxID=161469 RepID=UPI002AD338A8|nr:adenosine receptor A1-like [Phyllopteryx taeniolatus]XP_061633271.1 adenosine receptor A1-like [Phyllopteryx taeniolatus]
MEFLWLYSLCQCIVSVAVIVVSVRLCIAVGGPAADVHGGSQGASPRHGSVSYCLCLCLGWVGAIGGALEIPVIVFLNSRTPQCLYTCITLVCCPLLVRQFTMCLLVLLTLDCHLQHHWPSRYSSLVTCQRALCVVLLCWVATILTSFGQFISSDILDRWGRMGQDRDTADLGLDSNWTTPLPSLTPLPKYPYERMVIGKHLPYGGFLSKFYMDDLRNFTYAEIHSSHWGVCAPDTILSPQFLVYVHGTAVFMLPLLFLLFLYLDLQCNNGKQFSQSDAPKYDYRRLRSLALSVSFLVLLCLPLQISHAVLLFTPSATLPSWVHAMAVFFFQLYGLVPQVLFTPPGKRESDERGALALSAHLPEVSLSTGKSVHKALCEVANAASWASAKNSLKAKVYPEV